MTESVLLEIGVEEIPHEIITSAMEQLKTLCIEKLGKDGVVYGTVNIYGTPRRLAAVITGVEDKTPETVIEKKGPSLKASFDESGKPTKALTGFLESTRTKLEDIEKKEISGGMYVTISRKEGGLETKSILPELLKSIITSFSFPKAMKWGSGDMRFVRPVRWIISLWGSEIIPFTINGIVSDNRSFGHRFLSGGKSFPVKQPDKYLEALRDNFVIADAMERKSIITEQVKNEASKFKAGPVLDESLLDTLVNLTEYPCPAVGTFEEDFLKLPKEVLISEMIEHQKYIPLLNADSELINRFIIITNMPVSEAIVKGNERVIRARFSDGKFFFDEDRKVKLEDYLPRLAEVSFAKGLGTLADKAERLRTIVSELSKMPGYGESLKNADRTALLCKADLVTGMVHEFTELQGIIGYYYALASMENINTAVSIREHYLPKFRGDALPSLPEGILVSLADRLDNLFALYARGNFVGGSKDPFGLRRQTLGIIRILIEKKIHLDIRMLFEKLLPLYEGFLTVKKEEFSDKINDFLTSRVKTVLKEYGFSYDEIEAGISGTVSDLYDAYLRLEAIHTARKSENFINLAIAFKRVKNIIKGQKAGKPDKSLLVEDAEKELNDALVKNGKAFLKTLKEGDYPQCVSILTSFRPYVDSFFEKVLVMDKDRDLKNNRIALLSEIDGLFMKIIDFEKIVIE
jgi:glycyl-tRNA synthetase beta chain